MDTLTEMLAAVKAICEPAAQLDFRTQCEAEHPSLLWLYDELRLERSPEHAYKLVVMIADELKKNGMEETKNVRTDMVRDRVVREFNPGGSHLRIQSDGNVAITKERFSAYSPKHLSPQAEEILSQKLRYA